MDEPKEIQFSNHSIKQMFSRKISVSDIKEALSSKTIVAEYANDKPFPSYLVLGFAKYRPIHIVYAIDDLNNTTIIITAYEPSAEVWGSDFLTRKKD